jgi:cysteine-S-conjugate beta-lyase
MSKSTDLIHHPYQAPAGFAAPQPGVFKASTVIFQSTAAMRERTWKSKAGYTYGLHGTPTTFTLEERLCALDGARHCILAPSGLAAIALVNMALLQSGDEVLLPDNVYGPNLNLAKHELAQWGIKYQLYDPSSAIDAAQKLTEKTRLLWLEAAGSVTLEFPDLVGLSRLCRDKGVLTAIDHTWGAGLAYPPLAFDEGRGADIAVHALTKYPSGGGDVLMGSVTTLDDDLHNTLKTCHMRLGLGVGANDAEAVLRGLSSLHLRYAAQDASARALARWCQSRSEFAQVLHPALPGSPGHGHWEQVCGSEGAAAGLVSVVMPAGTTQAQVDKLCDSLTLFKLGYSWAGPMSLAVPYDMRTFPSQRLLALGEQHLIRFSIGLEEVNDLIADLDQALTLTFGC